jgi:hypothetical protein
LLQSLTQIQLPETSTAKLNPVKHWEHELFGQDMQLAVHAPQTRLDVLVHAADSKAPCEQIVQLAHTVFDSGVHVD